MKAVVREYDGSRLCLPLRAKRRRVFLCEGSDPNGANLRRIWDFGVGFWMGGFFWEHGPWICGAW